MLRPGPTGLLIASSALLLALARPGSAHGSSEPRSFHLVSLAEIRPTTLPWIDERTYREEDAAREAAGLGGALRFAATHELTVDLGAEGIWTELGAEGRLCRWSVESIGARNLNLGLSDFSLPEGATLHFYPPDRRWADGPYGAADAREGEFWSPIYDTDALVLELYVPSGARFEPSVVIGSVNHGYRAIGGEEGAEPGTPLAQGSCNNDVVCPVGDPWRAEIRSVGVYTRNGSWMCSGQLVNSHDPTRPPYFLTADHCGISIANDQTVVVYWNFESPDCGDLCCGDLSDRTTGSLFLADHATSDFSLIRLSSAPEPAFHVTYAGWDARESTAPALGVGIHHPNTDEKAISFNTNALAVTSYLSSSTPGNGSHWRVDDWEDGTTEPGSSGSGIWDENHRLVGQLHGGYASCTSNTADWYGRLSRSWTGGGSPATRLSDWLDPQGTGGLVLDLYDPDAPSAVEDAPATASGFTLRPQPARGEAWLGFALDTPARVRWEILDAAGRRVSRSAEEPLGVGEHERKCSLPATNGVYFMRLWMDGRATPGRKLLVIE